MQIVLYILLFLNMYFIIKIKMIILHNCIIIILFVIIKIYDNTVVFQIYLFID